MGKYQTWLPLASPGVVDAVVVVVTSPISIYKNTILVLSYQKVLINFKNHLNNRR